MHISRNFTLERPARRSGGDRYEEQVPVGEEPIMGMTYVNQSISRISGSPVNELTITITTKEE